MADKKFDPEGTGYDYETAKKRGIKPDETGHWPSRDPKTGVLLKGRGHKTWHKTVTGEEKAGYEIYKRGNRYYSRPKKNKKNDMERSHGAGTRQTIRSESSERVRDVSGRGPDSDGVGRLHH